jgi:hypothetical protein
LQERAALNAMSSLQKALRRCRVTLAGSDPELLPHLDRSCNVLSSDDSEQAPLIGYDDAANVVASHLTHRIHYAR